MTSFASPLPESVERWVALRTSARWEKHLADALARCNVPAYLPLLRTVRVYGSKRRDADLPLFPGYVFCSEADFRGNPAVPKAVRSRIAQVLSPPDPEELRRELGEVAAFLACRRLVQERVCGRPGDAVKVVRGAFAGQRGVIRQLLPGRQCIVLEISFLGVRVELEFEEHLVRRE